MEFFIFLFPQINNIYHAVGMINFIKPLRVLGSFHPAITVTTLPNNTLSILIMTQVEVFTD